MPADGHEDRSRMLRTRSASSEVDGSRASSKRHPEDTSSETQSHHSLGRRRNLFSELGHLEHNFEQYALGPRRNAIKRTTALKTVTEWSKLRLACLQITESGMYNVGMVLIIILNVVHLVQETDMRSKKVDSPPFMIVISRTFLAVYLVDLLLRVFVFRSTFLNSGMNIFDTLVVVVDTVLTVLPGPLSGLPSMSVLRGLRMLRIVRVIRNLVAFRELYLMMQGLVSAVRAIIFGTALIVAVLILWSILAVELVHEKNLQLFQEGAYGDCSRCEHAFESVGHSMLTFTSTIIAGDSWGMLALPLIERVPWTMLIILPALLSLELGLLNVVAAVIVDRQAQARQDDEKFLHQMRDEELRKSYSRLKSLFSSMDDDGSGSLTLEEMIEAFRTHAEFKELMELMDIGEDDLSLVFQILDKDRSGDVTYDEFVEQLNTMRTTNSHTLLVFIKHLASRISEQADDHYASLERISCGLGLAPLKDEGEETQRLQEGDLFEEKDHWYEESQSFETLQAEGKCAEAFPEKGGNGTPTVASAAMGKGQDAASIEAVCDSAEKPQSAWSMRAVPAVCNSTRPAGGAPPPRTSGHLASAAAADMNKRFLALSRHIQSSLAAITEDAVRQAGDNVLWESTLALASLQASLPLLHVPARPLDPMESSAPRRLPVKSTQPGPTGASCPRVHPLHLQARGEAPGSAEDCCSGPKMSGRAPQRLSGLARRRATGGGAMPMTPEDRGASPAAVHELSSPGDARGPRAGGRG